MQISFNPSLNIPNSVYRVYQTSPVHRYPIAAVYNKLCGPECDCVCFTGKNKAEKKKAELYEEHLKSLENVHDPYSDVVMISKPKFKSLQASLVTCGNADDMIKVMTPMKKHMFAEGEARVFDMLISETERLKTTKKYRGKQVTFQDILDEHYGAARARLADSRYGVLDKMREYAKDNFTLSEQASLESKLGMIEDSIDRRDFRIKPTLSHLHELYDEISDKKKVDKILRFTEEFPNCANSVDAFIVKNAGKTSAQIAEALVSPSIISVEHIKPQTSGGEDKGSNYLAASQRMNNMRGSMSYEEFIERFPEIPECIQRHFDELSAKSNRGEIPDIAMNLPGMCETLKRESNGRIDVKLSLNDVLRGKIAEMQSKLDDLLEHFGSKD